MDGPLLVGLDLGHLALPTESEGPRDLTRAVYPAALFLSSFLGLCPLLTSLPSGSWFPGNSPWGGGRKEWPIHILQGACQPGPRWVDYRKDW